MRGFLVLTATNLFRRPVLSKTGGCFLLLTVCSILNGWSPVNAEETTDVLLQSARTLFSEGDFESAEETLRVALSKVENNTMRHVVCLQNLALIEYLNFHFVEAQKLYESALSISETSCGKESVPVANNLYGLSRCLRRAKQNEAAGQILNRLLELRIKLLGSDHRLVGNTLFDIAVNYEREGKYDLALSYYAKALDLREKDYGKTSICLKSLLETYAVCLRKAQNDNKASELEARLKDLTQSSNATLPSTFTGSEDGSNWQTTIYQTK